MRQARNIQPKELRTVTLIALLHQMIGITLKILKPGHLNWNYCNHIKGSPGFIQASMSKIQDFSRTNVK